MTKEIGFHYGAPENKDMTWERMIGGTTFVFKKERVKSFFLYNCRCRTVRGPRTSDSSTGFHLVRDEVEQLPQFHDFIRGSRG
jgi:hypothetical protein